MAPTTRRFPRSLAEAFPDERACAVERPRRRTWLYEAGMCVAFAGVVLLFIVGAHTVARYFGG
jgi:hypothetical protein